MHINWKYIVAMAEDIVKETVETPETEKAAAALVKAVAEGIEAAFLKS